MADKKISELVVASVTPNENSLLELSEETAPAVFESRKISLSSLKSNIANVDSGVYTPVATIVANVTTVTPLEARWLRIGNVVKIGGSYNLQGIGNPSQFRFSLPVLSDFVSQDDATGVTIQSTTGGSTNIYGTVGANVATDLLQFNVLSTISLMKYSYELTYEIK